MGIFTTEAQNSQSRIRSDPFSAHRVIFAHLCEFCASVVNGFWLFPIRAIRSQAVRRFFRFSGLGACAGAFGCAIMCARVSGGCPARIIV